MPIGLGSVVSPDTMSDTDEKSIVALYRNGWNTYVHNEHKL